MKMTTREAAKVVKVMKGTIRAFDVDSSPCACLGTKHKMSRLQVIAVRWKRTDNDPNGRVRFQCMRCKTTWSKEHVKRAGSGIHMDGNDPEEKARRKVIHPDYDKVIAVNLGGSPGQANFPGEVVNLIGGTRKATGIGSG